MAITYVDTLSRYRLINLFCGFLRFVVWQISGHFWGVYQSHYCPSECAFLFSFVYVMYLNIASHLYGKQIKSKLVNKLCLWMTFIRVHLNVRYLPYHDPLSTQKEYRVRHPLSSPIAWRTRFTCVHDDINKVLIPREWDRFLIFRTFS